MQTTTLALSCRFLDRFSAARFAIRSTLRAGATPRRAAFHAASVLLLGRASLALRPFDADLYTAISGDVAAAHRVAGALAIGAA